MAKNEGEFIRLDCPRCGATLKIEGELFTCQHCGAKLILRNSIPARSSGDPNQPSPVNKTSGVELIPFSYFDPQSGVEAFSILVPKGWQVSGGVTWVLNRPAAPVQVNFLAANPNGVEAFEGFPIQYFTWTNNPMIQMTNPPGSLYFGYEVCQPMPARDAMRQFVLPRFRRIQDLAIMEEGPSIELQRVVASNPPGMIQAAQYSYETVRMRLHYTINRTAVAEELSGATEYTRVTTPGLFGVGENVFWSMGYLSAFRAERGKLEGYADLYRAIYTSVKINPAWTAVVQQVSQGLTSNTIHGIHQIGALSRQISQNYQEMSDANFRGWQARSAIHDRIAETASQVIRGVDPYFDPNSGRTVELPSGYTQAWSTPLGEYLLSDDPNFDPNVGSTQNWTLLSPPEN